MYVKLAPMYATICWRHASMTVLEPTLVFVRLGTSQLMVG